MKHKVRKYKALSKQSCSKNKRQYLSAASKLTENQQVLGRTLRNFSFFFRLPTTFSSPLEPSAVGGNLLVELACEEQNKRRAISINFIIPTTSSD